MSALNGAPAPSFSSSPSPQLVANVARAAGEAGPQSPATGSSSVSNDARSSGTPAVDLSRYERADLGISTQLDFSAGLTPESIIQHAGNRLGDLDQQIMSAMTMLDERRAMSQSIGGDISALQSIQKAFTSDGKDQRKKLENLTVTLPGRGTQNAADFIRANHLESLLSIDAGKMSGKTELSLDTVQTAVDQLRSQQTQLNSRTDGDMISLQENINRRGKVIELASKIIQSMHDSERSVLANIGR